MSGYIVVLTVFTIYLLPDSYALFAKFANRVLRCPNPNNITEWEQASTKLACLHPLRGGSSDQLARVYHCLPSNFFNESVEYCGYSGPVTKGNCPVYKYGDGRNRAASYRSCANFTSGCPEKQYHSKDVYNYPACLNINTVDKCYVAEPMCEKSYESATDSIDLLSTESDRRGNDKGVIDHTQISSTGSDVMIVVIVILLVIIIGLVASFILWRKKIVSCPMLTTNKDKRVRYNAVNQTVDIETDTTDADILNMPFNVFFGDVGREISREALIKLKDHLKASERKLEKQKIDEIATGSEAIDLMHQRYDFNINLYLLQSILELIGEEQLAERCGNFGKTHRQLFYYKGHVNAEGYREIVLKVDKNIDDYHREDLERMKKRLRHLLSGPEPNDIVIKTINEGCIAIHALVRQKVFDMIKSADLSSLREDCVVEVIVDGECLGITEKDVSLSCFEVSFDYGPTALATHKRVADTLKQHRKTMGLVDPRYDSVIIVHHTESDLSDIVQELFESDPIIHGKKKYDSVQNVEAVGNIVIFCCDRLSQDIVYQSLKNTDLGEDCKENHFIFSMENIEETDLDYSALLKTKMGTKHILRPKSDKSLLYNAYCARVQEEFKLFKQMIGDSKLKNSTHYSEISGSLEKLEEMLDSHSQKQQTNPAGNVARNYLPEMESYGIYGCMIDDDTLWIFGQNLEEIDEAKLKLLKHNFKMHNIEVVQSSIIFYGFLTGSKLLFSHETTESFASVGMFATLRKFRTTSLVCTGSGHIGMKNDTMYYDDGIGREILGTCIWPNTSSRAHHYFINVVCLDEKLHRLVQNEVRKEIKIFDGDFIELMNQKVYKMGAASGHTVGYIEREFHMLRHRAVIVAREKEDTCFAKIGDSGAIVFTKRGMDTVALGIVVGSIEMHTEKTPVLPLDPILVVSLKDALCEFTQQYDCEIENPFILI